VAGSARLPVAADDQVRFRRSVRRRKKTQRGRPGPDSSPCAVRDEALLVIDKPRHGRARRQRRQFRVIEALRQSRPAGKFLEWYTGSTARPPAC